MKFELDNKEIQNRFDSILKKLELEKGLELLEIALWYGYKNAICYHNTSKICSDEKKNT